tara:strand:- start:667 stop:1983 length:1317 start_codon:yes stop_codon:yes gene_type:complete
MPVYKFNRNDVYVNTLRTYPEVKYFIYSGSSYYNNTPNIPGEFTGSIRATEPGSLSLYELNVDRAFIPAGANPQNDKYITTVTDEAGVIIADQSIRDTGLIYQFMTKDSTRLSFSSVSSTAYAAGTAGDIMRATLPYTSSIRRNYYTAAQARYTNASVATNDTTGSYVSNPGSVSYLRALKNTLNHYKYISPHYAYSSSASGRDLDSVQVGLINIPTIFYGSNIKPGSVKLEFYVTGALRGRLEDKYQNGVLWQTAPLNSPGSGSIAGVALYSEGFLLLTGSWDLSDGDHTEDYGGTNNYPSWVNFGADPSTGGTIIANSSSYSIELSGTSKIQTLTMFATAPKGELNQSSNPTFVSHSLTQAPSTSSMGYVQNQELSIKNIVSASYATPTGSFDRTTYIAKVGIYDENMNLIAIAKPSTPVRKTASRDFTFKLELDL